MNKQDEVIAKLEKQGWRFQNWYYNGDEQTAVMVRKIRGSLIRETCEVDAEGNVN